MAKLLDDTLARTDPVRVKLAPAMVKRLEALATDHGMPASTMAAFAIAQWIRQQEQNKLNALHSVRSLTQQVASSFAPEALEQGVIAAMAAMNKQQAVSIDHEEAESSQ